MLFKLHVLFMISFEIGVSIHWLEMISFVMVYKNCNIFKY